MANKQINALTNLPTMANDDLLLVYDVDGAGSEKTKNMTYSQFHSQISGTVGGGGGGNPDALYYNTTDVRATATNAGITLGDARTFDIDDDGSGNWTFYNSEDDGTIDFRARHSFLGDKTLLRVDSQRVYLGEQGSGGIRIGGTGGNGDIETYGGDLAIRLAFDAVELMFDEAIKLETTNTGIAVTGDVSISSMPSGATQVAAGVTVGDLWRTDTHATLPDGVVMIGI